MRYTANQVLFAGNLTKDADEYEYGSGKEKKKLTRFRMASGSGERVVFIDVVYFFRKDDFDYGLEKGNNVVVEGRLSLNKGNEEYPDRLEIIAHRITNLSLEFEDEE